MNPRARPLDTLRARVRLAWHEASCAVLGPIVPKVSRWRWLSRVPAWPFRSIPAPWTATGWEAPDALKTVPGIWRDEEEASRAAAAGPLYYFFTLYPEAARLLPRFGWAWQLPSIPRRQRTVNRTAEVSAAERQPPGPPPVVGPEALTQEVRDEARRLGLSQVGFAPFDPRYVYDRRATDTGSVFEAKAGQPVLRPTAPSPISEGSVIVCVLEQDWALTQAIPSASCERGVMRTYNELINRAAALVDFLHARGFEAQLHGPGGALVAIHYAVEAGLGQLGLNGQLLTPQAGSRCRLTIITTNANLAHGAPVDFGINAICDQCRLCVKRCPPGAIPAKREPHRGVLKAKIKPERCAPTMAQAHGCAICMKVCPVQRYGLAAVTGHLVATGEILGKGTDELEGYEWLDGRHYGPGEKPPMNREFLTPAGVALEAGRKRPVAEGNGHRSELDTLA